MAEANVAEGNSTIQEAWDTQTEDFNIKLSLARTPWFIGNSLHMASLVAKSTINGNSDANRYDREAAYPPRQPVTGGRITR